MPDNTRATPRPDRDAIGGSGLPTHHQKLILGAALFHPQLAQQAWKTWRTQFDPQRDFIEPGSRRLLPLAHHNLLHNQLASADVEDAHRSHATDTTFAAQLKQRRLGILVKNQRLLYDCAQLLKMFHAANIDTILLKGAALVSSQTYADASLRPMSDFDVLIQRAQAPVALALLEREGWRVGSMDYDHFDEDFLTVRHAQNFGGPHRTNFDLHWHALPNSMDTGLDAEFWERAQPLTLHNTQTHTLSPTDQLLHVGVHGAAWAPIPPIHWIADAVMILRASQGQKDPARQIDWTRLVDLARRYQLGLTLCHTLGYLQEHILPHTAGVQSIPAQVLASLAQTQVSRIERRLFRAHTQRSGTFGQLPLLWARYRYYLARRRSMPAHERPARRLSFARYMAVFYGYRSLPEVLRWAVNRSYTRIRRLIIGT